MQTLLQDLRYAVRLLLKQPVFTIIAVLTLALGIGANTAIFSIIDAALLRPLPYPESNRLVRVWGSAPERGLEMKQIAVSFPRYEAIHDGQDVFEEIAADTGGRFTMTGRGDPELVRSRNVSARFFETLGVTPGLGRSFLPAEDRPGGPNVVILSQPFWQKHFGGDPSLLGRTLTLDGTPYTVVGILPAPLAFPFDRPDLYVPRAFDTTGVPEAMVRQGTAFLTVTARLKPGVSVRQANEAMQILAARYRQAFPDHVDASTGLKVIPFQEEIVGETRPTFYTLAAAVGCVLLIACVNVANLLLARLAGRRKEIAIRAALGAGHWRLARQFLTESILLAVLAGGIGVLLAVWGVDLVRGLGRNVIARADEIHISVGTLAFTAGVSLFTGLLLGIVPALRAARGDGGEALQQAGSRGAVGGGVQQGRTRSALLIAQVALSLVLLTGTGLLLTSLWRLQRVQMGFNAGGILTNNLSVPNARYPQPAQQADFYERLVAQLAALPGVRAAAVSSDLPLTNYGGLMFYAVVGQPVPPVEKRASARDNEISPGYFSALEIPLLRGRTFTDRDRADQPPVMMINQSMARRLFPDGDAIGQKLLCTAFDPTVTEIVGVVADVRAFSLAEPPPDEMYFPHMQRPQPFMSVVVKASSTAQAAALAPAMRAAVHALDSSEPMGDFRTMDEVIALSMADRRLMSFLLAGFAVLALVLAAIGIYGVTAYGVAQRTREIGIRMALGAGRGDVFRLIVGGGMKLILIGVGLGLLAAFGLTRLLGSLLYGVGAGDPLTFVGVVGVLGFVALLANYLPARRATRIDPMVALREE